jgi:hypothetical protein
MLTPNRAQDLVKGALQTKAPALYRALQQHGTLDLFIAELEQEMREFVAAQLDRVQARAAQNPHLDYWQTVQDLMAAQRGVEEQAIATYLEFPPEAHPPEEHLQAWWAPFASCACVRE